MFAVFEYGCIMNVQFLFHCLENRSICRSAFFYICFYPLSCILLICTLMYVDTVDPYNKRNSMNLLLLVIEVSHSIPNSTFALAYWSLSRWGGIHLVVYPASALSHFPYPPAGSVLVRSCFHWKCSISHSVCIPAVEKHIYHISINM